VYDGNLVIQERHYTPHLSTNHPQQTITYTRGRDLSGTLEGAGGIGGLLARTASEISNLQSPSHAYYHADGNGNVTALIATNQAVVARYLYDPYGNQLAATGPLAEANLYRFSSKEWHPPSGLVYYGYRFYDPSLQRWVNRDPIGEAGCANLYRALGNCPLSFYDAFGLADLPPGFVGPPLPSPGLPDPSWKPPGWKPSWPEGWDGHRPFYLDPDTGTRWYPHPEDANHWPHYDNDQGVRYPQKCIKPWPNQKRPPYGNQSPQNPWPKPVPPVPPRPPNASPWWHRIPIPIPIFIMPGQIPNWMLGEPSMV
jgi:RHS repeat-associated protein